MKQTIIFSCIPLMLAASHRLTATDVPDFAIPASQTITEAGDRAEPAAPQPRPVIEFDREKLAAFGIKASVASNTVEKFFQTHARFTPADLAALVLQNDQGRSVPLSQVATIRYPERRQ